MREGWVGAGGVRGKEMIAGKQMQLNKTRGDGFPCLGPNLNPCAQIN